MTRSIRLSGTNQITATATNNATETQGTKNEHARATRYRQTDALPFRSFPIASASFESGPCEASRQIVRTVNASAQARSTIA